MKTIIHSCQRELYVSRSDTRRPVDGSYTNLNNIPYQNKYSMRNLKILNFIKIKLEIVYDFSWWCQHTLFHSRFS